MMSEHGKLREAEYFLGQMLKGDIQADTEVFGYIFSAFLSASRSVLQYIRERARTAGALPWFDCRRKSTVWCDAFRDLRNVNIHWEDMRPGTQNTIVCQDGWERVGGGPIRPIKATYATSVLRAFRPIYRDTVEQMTEGGELRLIGHRYRALVFTDEETGTRSLSN